MRIGVQDYIQEREDEGTRTEWSSWDYYSVLYSSHSGVRGREVKAIK